MMVPRYEMRVRENRLPYLVSIGKTRLTDEETHQNPKKMVEIIRRVYHADRLPEEHMYMMVFDNKLHLTGLFEISHGTCRETLVNPAQIMQRLFLCGASVFCIAHTHPSGDVTPSVDDDRMTSRLAAVAKICGVDFCDHIIIGGAHKDRFFSYREQTDLLP